MREMTPDEIRSFLSDGTRTAKLATTREDGRPHVTPVWFVLDGDDIVFNTSAASVKGRNLARDGRAALTVDDQTPPYSHVIVEGAVTISNDLQAMVSFSTRIAARYMGDERAEEFGRRNAVEGELLIRLSPTKYNAKLAMAD